MNKIDAHKLKPESQQQLRHQAVRLRKKGSNHKQIAEIIGALSSRICRRCRAYEESGPTRVKIKQRGRKHGSGRTLSQEQEKRLREMISDKTPDQLKFPFALWTCFAVQQVVRQQWGLRMPIRTVGEYLKRWGYTPQKPTRRAYEQNLQRVEKWLSEEYPAILERAKQERAEIHWGDETGLCNGYQYGRSYAPMGKTPTVRLCAAKERIGLVSTVTNQGQMRFMVYRNAMNATIMKKFLARLIKDAERKVFLIVANLKVHHSKLVNEWLKAHEDQIEIFFLPLYCPELNPDEYLNGDLKSGVYKAESNRTRSQLTKKSISHLRSLQRQPQRVKKLFCNPKVAYAAYLP
jgi:transposase